MFAHSEIQKKLSSKNHSSRAASSQDRHLEAEANSFADSFRSGQSHRPLSGGPSQVQFKGRQNSPSASGAQIINRLQATKGQGTALPQQLGQQLGQSLGMDESKVRLHTDDRAANLNRGMNARAFTLGNDIFFGKGEYQPNSPKGQHLLAHEMAHVKQQTGLIHKQEPQEGQAAAGPMTRDAFIATMRDTYGVQNVAQGTEEEQRRELGIASQPNVVIAGWQAWDPGDASETYQAIVDSFSEVNTAFGGFPTVDSIKFYKHYYEMKDGVPTVNDDVGASFGLRDMNIYGATEHRMKGLPMARSNSTGEYGRRPVATLGYNGDPNAAPVGLPSRRQTVMRIIIHELGHGIQVAASTSNYQQPGQAAADPNMLQQYMRAVGWQGYDKLFDIQEAEVQTAIAASTEPPAQFRIMPENWNDPKWKEQPVSSYMVSGGPGEDFAEAIMTFVENPALLLSRSPARHAFISSHKDTWRTVLSQTGPRQAAQPSQPSQASPPSSGSNAPIPGLGPILPQYQVNPFMLMPFNMLPAHGPIDWGAMRAEVVGRGALYDGAMQDSIEQTWMQSYRFYNQVLGFRPDTATTLTNTTMPRMIGGALTMDYPTVAEASDRASNISSFVLPVSDILRYLITK